MFVIRKDFATSMNIRNKSRFTFMDGNPRSTYMYEVRKNHLRRVHIFVTCMHACTYMYDRPIRADDTRDTSILRFIRINFSFTRMEDYSSLPSALVLFPWLFFPLENILKILLVSRSMQTIRNLATETVTRGIHSADLQGNNRFVHSRGSCRTTTRRLGVL